MDHIIVTETELLDEAIYYIDNAPYMIPFRRNIISFSILTSFYTGLL